MFHVPGINPGERLALPRDLFAVILSYAEQNLPLRVALIDELFPGRPSDFNKEAPLYIEYGGNIGDLMHRLLKVCPPVGKTPEATTMRPDACDAATHKPEVILHQWAPKLREIPGWHEPIFAAWIRPEYYGRAHNISGHYLDVVIQTCDTTPYGNLVFMLDPANSKIIQEVRARFTDELALTLSTGFGHSNVIAVAAEGTFASSELKGVRIFAVEQALGQTTNIISNALNHDGRYAQRAGVPHQKTLGFMGEEKEVAMLSEGLADAWKAPELMEILAREEFSFALRDQLTAGLVVTQDGPKNVAVLLRNGVTTGI